MNTFDENELGPYYCSKCNEELEPVRYNDGLQGFKCPECKKIFDFLGQPTRLDKIPL